MLNYEVVEHGKPLQARIRETPQPQAGEVLVRITRSGVCHSDLHIWEGYFDLGGGKRFYVKDRGCVPPFTTGHEPFGVVEKVGAGVTGVKVGDKRLVYPWIGCGKCAVCEAGDDNFCLSGRFLGVMAHGAYSTHVLVPDAKYLIDTTGIDDGWAATLACSGLTVYSAATKLPKLAPRDWVVVLGCGGLGMAAISVLRALGITNIIAGDIDEGKLARAREQGAAQTVDTRDAGALDRIKAISAGAIAGVIDLVGMPATANLGIASLAKGGHYIMCGLFGGDHASAATAGAALHCSARLLRRKPGRAQGGRRTRTRRKAQTVTRGDTSCRGRESCPAGTACGQGAGPGRAGFRKLGP